MFINDVGEGTWEEINDGVAGSNYGWPITEGTTTDPRFRSPLFTYQHGSGGNNGCAITGGTFYNPATVQFPSSYVGKYFFADYCNNWIRVFESGHRQRTGFCQRRVGSRRSASRPGRVAVLPRARRRNRGPRARGQQPTTYHHGPTGQPHRRGGSNGDVQRRRHGLAAALVPMAARHHQYRRATSASYALVAAAGDNGATFRVIVNNAFGSATSSSATLTVSSNAAPVATITAPATGALYAGGDTINYAGTGSDTEDGTLPASAFTWEVVFHHATHTHPFVAPTSGAKSGSFTIPRLGEVATDVFYRIHLTVVDSAGLSHTTTRDIAPRVSTISLRTTPPGLQVSLDGTPVTTPADVSSVVGMTRQLGVVSPQTSGGSSYGFSSWSDGGAATHSIDTPSTNTIYTATYAVSTGGGLTAQYFDNIDFTNLKVTRTDPTVNFDFGTGSPDPLIAADSFSVRWTGTITPAFSQAYTIYTTSDDGIRVTITARS